MTKKKSSLEESYPEALKTGRFLWDDAIVASKGNIVRTRLLFISE
jgi:hypothetical protein